MAYIIYYNKYYNIDIIVMPLCACHGRRPPEAPGPLDGVYYHIFSIIILKQDRRRPRAAGLRAGRALEPRAAVQAAPTACSIRPVRPIWPI